MANDMFGITYYIKIYTNYSRSFVLELKPLEVEKTPIATTLPSYNSTTEKKDFLGLVPQEIYGNCLSF